MEVVSKESSASESTFRPLFRQLVICLISWSFYFMFGLSMGAPTVIVPQLRSQANSTEAVSYEMASWITSILGYSGMVWVIILATTAHYIGRKKTWFIAAVNSLLAFVILYYSTTALQIFIAQFLLGLNGGTQTTVSMMMLTECSSPKYRGLFMTLKSASFFWGIWTANAIGTFFHFKYIGLLGVLCSLYNLVTIYFITESPYWLAFKGRYDECAKTHYWLKGCKNDAVKELEMLIESQKEIKCTLTKNPSLSSIIRTFVSMSLQPEVYKPTVLCLLVQGMYFLSGKLVFAVYAIEIMKNITNNQSVAYTAMLILDGFTVLGMYVGSFLARILRRKLLLLVSSITSIFFIFIMSLYLYIVKLRVVSENNFISIGLLIGFSLSIACGVMILSPTISGELYPVKGRGFTICFVAIVTKFFLGTTLKLSPLLFKYFDCHGTFLFYGIVSLICLILAYKFIPETKDKTLQEIEAIFTKNKNVNDLTESKLLQNP